MTDKIAEIRARQIPEDLAWRLRRVAEMRRREMAARELRAAR